ncbi:MAG: hypothetical protein JNK11_03550, partial [Alphaproteobacteria bacterium]|nr:hypothetical protein [Alphaproteobacteria bacterium]
MAAIWAGAIAFSAQERAFAIRMAEQTTAALASAYREHISNMLERVDDLLMHAKQEFEADPARFDFSHWAEASPHLLRLATQFSRVDRDGVIIASSQGSVAIGVSIADREHFKVHAERDTGLMHVSKPVLGRTTGKFSIQISRRLNGADGAFAGVLIFSLDAAYLAKVYGEGQIGRNGVTSLTGFDGVVRVRTLGDRAEIGVAELDVPLFRTLLASPEGTHHGPSARDGAARVTAWEHVDAYPLVVAVSASVPEMIEQYAR